ncbi:efflux RND transporter periplasmic adaptor subunit [Thiocapsa bogorovii]|uniref:efflux RND transporter periplasmic adaptor subunit n=1 Tax=Thiocapsa bogorovii TaxID=521689 RepID=UPI001E6241C8|nr:efflux RND transporter periplasmic adaptor subunit [Thiocapsa bogorovii]UHD17541.1 efflux RND transporter periplasmic adaptor subunit [Thiocapsa bogorovii]
MSTLLTGCLPTDEEASQPVPEPIRPVRVVTVEELPGGERVTLTGNIQAQDDVALAFRVGGQLIERTVNVGDQVVAGQVVARLDAVNERNAVDAARANLAAAMARLVEARNTVRRFEPMLPQGFVARADFDRAVEARDAAQAQVEAAQAQVATAENQLGFTTLLADGPGTVTERGAEPGEVVAAGRMIVRLAREAGRDAVFDVPARVIESGSADDEVTVALSSDPTVTTSGRVREVSPQADPVTRTFQVRVGLANPPAAMRLGSTVTGSIQLGGAAGIEIPNSALTSARGAPAVWVLDPQTNTVALRNIDVARFELDRVLIAQGLDAGELVVTAGVQTLRPGQQVRRLGEPVPDETEAETSEPAVGQVGEPTSGEAGDDTGDTASEPSVEKAEARP